MGSVKTRRSNLRAYKRNKAVNKYIAAMNASKGGVTVTKFSPAEFSATTKSN
jgi:hypothetical protein